MAGLAIVPHFRVHAQIVPYYGIFHKIIVTAGTRSEHSDGSTVASTGRDTIYDFKSNEGDRIDLAAIVANWLLSGDQAFKFIETQAFHPNTSEGIKKASEA